MKSLIGCIVVALLAPSLVWGKIGGGDIVFRPAGAATVVYSHDTHVGKNGLKCSECHPKIFKMSDGYGKTTMANMDSGQSCGACHNGKRTFATKGSCEKCHH